MGIKTVLETGIDEMGCYQMHSLKQAFSVGISRKRLYNFDPIKPHFYIVKLGFTGVY